MKKLQISMLLASCLALLLPGCNEQGNPTQVPQPSFRNTTVATFSVPSLLPQNVVLGGFTVSYQGRTIANNQTTFTYIVTGPRESFDFRLELPPCAGTLASSLPKGGLLNDNDEDDPAKPGIEWVLRRGAALTTRDTFSVTYSGIVREGIVLTAVERYNHYNLGLIAGACARVFDISGTVFNDANTDGILGASETGIVGVTVNLLDSNNVFLESLVSDPFGNYKFESVPFGRYSVVLDTSTLVTTSTKYLGATTPTSRSVTGGPDSPGNDFGFNPKTTQLVTDLKSGVLPTNGLTPDFWEDQLYAAISGKGKHIVSKDSLLVYITRIRALELPEPFQFGTGDGLKAAYDSLESYECKHPTDLMKLKNQLIALEFNWVSRHGIVGTDAPLQLVLVGWGESIVAGQAGGAVPFSVKGSSAATTMSIVTDATQVFQAINKSSGGGGTF